MKKNTLHTLQALKAEGKAITMLTAYDATFAKLISEQGVESILIGDSLGMVMQGLDSTVSVSMQSICYHIRCVAQGNTGAFLIGDMPYMSYATEEQALENAAHIMQAGANMVKLEGGEWLLSSIKKLTDCGIPVCAHLGLTPQSVDALGGFKVQGRDKAQAKKIINDALALEKAGASLLVLECVPQQLAKQITEKLSIPTIGIGAGKYTDGQVLVLQDMLGLNTDFKPKFVRDFMNEPQTNNVGEAIAFFVQSVKNKSFPSDEHSFN